MLTYSNYVTVQTSQTINNMLILIACVGINSYSQQDGQAKQGEVTTWQPCHDGQVLGQIESQGWLVKANG